VTTPREPGPDPLAIVAKLAAQERELAEKPVLAPVVAGGRVRVRLSGIVYQMELEDPAFEGWAILSMVAPGRARVVDKPTRSLVTAYLKLMPRVRLILLDQHQRRWWGIAAQQSDKRFRIDKAVPLCLVGQAASFDTVYARFDGSAFWWEGPDRRRDPGVARGLRKARQDDVSPESLHVRGMVPQERLAYQLLWLLAHPEALTSKELGAILPGQGLENRQAGRLTRALDHAGAQLDSFWNTEQGSTVVRFYVDGREHVVEVRTDDLTVLSSGICLSDMDQDFDLTSLVDVLREHEGQDDGF